MACERTAVPVRPEPQAGRSRQAMTKKGNTMAVVRTHHYTIEPASLAELLARRAALITAVRAAYPGLAGTRLTRLEDGTFNDSWRWDTAEHMRAASPATSLPEARAAMSLTRDHTARYGEIVDER